MTCSCKLTHTSAFSVAANHIAIDGLSRTGLGYVVSGAGKTLEAQRFANSNSAAIIAVYERESWRPAHAYEQWFEVERIET